MANAELIVALVALIVSLVALVITVTQLLADLLATAEGRRKTSSMVMGPFGTLTEKSFRWRELCFEIHYVSPHLVLNESKRRDYPTQSDRQLKKDKDLSEKTYYSLDYGPVIAYVDLSGRRPDQGWQDLLGVVRDSAIIKHDQPERIGHALQIELRRRPWDALPDDVGRAVATTELFDILVIARRLGAIWRPWDSLSETLRAEGQGHVFISTEIRGLGLAMSYQYMGAAKEDIKTETRVTETEVDSGRTSPVWSREANKFMFGICPGNDDFYLIDFMIGDRDKLVGTWNHGAYLDIPTGDNVKSWADLFSRKHGVELRHSTNDLIALVCPMIRPDRQDRTSSYMGQVLLPFAANFENMFQGHGIKYDFRGREIFVQLLENEVKQIDSDPLRKILDIARTLINLDKSNGLTTISDVSTFLDRAQDGYNATTKYFKVIEEDLKDRSEKVIEGQSHDDTPKDMEKRAQKFYWHLMCAHLSISPLVHGTAMKNFRNGEDRARGRVKMSRRRIRCEQVYLLFDNIGHFQNYMADRGYGDSELVKEAWMVLFFRGMCWSLCHVADGLGTFLPVEYYGSQMPVYLI